MPMIQVWKSCHDDVLALIKNQGSHEDVMSAISRLHGPSAWHSVYNKQMNLLFHAVHESNLMAFELLLFKGADPSRINENGEGLCGLMASKSHIGTKWGDLSLRILDQVDKKAFVNHAGRGTGWTPLMAASDGGNLAWVKWLVLHGADINAKMSSTNWTALHAASKGGHADVVAFLLENGAKKTSNATHREFGRLLTVADVAKEGSGVLLVLANHKQ